MYTASCTGFESGQHQINGRGFSLFTDGGDKTYKPATLLMDKYDL